MIHGISCDLFLLCMCVCVCNILFSMCVFDLGPSEIPNSWIFRQLHLTGACNNHGLNFGAWSQLSIWIIMPLYGVSAFSLVCTLLYYSNSSLYTLSVSQVKVIFT